MNAPSPIDLTSPKYLFICASWHQVVLSFAYLDSVNNFGSHDFLILADANISRVEQEFIEIRQALHSFGHRQVDWLQAREAEYEELHISPAYAMFADDKRETDSIRHNSLILHGDGLRNGVYVDHRLASDVRGVVQYGLRLIERSVLSTKLRMELVQNSHVVPLASLSHMWKKLNSLLHTPPSSGLVLQNDLLVCERYWGSGHYQMRNDADSGAHLRSVLRLVESGYERVIFRPTTSHGTEEIRWREEIREYSEAHGLTFVTWSEIFEQGGSAAILSHPEAQFLLVNLSQLGGLYAFDGSLSVLIAALSEDTRVHWADSAATDDMFVYDRISQLIVEQGQWMREVAGAKKESDENGSLGDFFTDGSTYNAIIAEIYLENSRTRLADKDSQLADKDAQLADKDASLSWRITNPVRVLGKLFPPRK